MATKPKIMVVDDEKENLDLLYRTFRREFKVFRAQGAAQALELLDKEGEMAVILSDQSMPEMSGVEFFRQTADRFPKTVRILITGYASDQLGEGEDELKAAQIHKFVSKPWQADDLKATVQEAVQIHDA
jgi:response regulator RpfG family c-di-GMP phosphodiesterase